MVRKLIIAFVAASAMLNSVSTAYSQTDDFSIPHDPSIEYANNLKATTPLPIGKVPWSASNIANGIAGTGSDTSISNVPKRIYIFIGSARSTDFSLLTSNADELVNSGQVTLNPGYNWQGVSQDTRVALDAYWKYSNMKLSTTGGGETLTAIGNWETTAASMAGIYSGGQYGEELESNIYNAGAGNSSYKDPTSGVTYGCYATADDLATVKMVTDSAFKFGGKNLSVTSSPNCGTEDFSQPFATGEFWANVRAMALYGGGLTVDIAPTFFFNHPTPTGYPGDVSTEYPDMIAQMIVWAKQNGLRTTASITDDNTGGYDPNLLKATQAEIDYLRSKNAIPSEFVIGTYKTSGTSNGPTGDYDSSGNSVNQIAKYLLTVKPADAGWTYPQASGGLPGNMLMKGNIRYNPNNQKLDSMGSMGQQSVNDVHIHGGDIGDTWSNSSGIHINLPSAGGSSFFTQVPLIFGGGNGNSVLQGSSSDGYLHLSNPYVGTQVSGLVFGTDTTAPSILRDGSGLSTAANLNGQSLSSGSYLLLYSGTHISPYIYSGTSDSYVHIGSAFTSDHTLLGLAFDDGSTKNTYAKFVGIGTGTGAGSGLSLQASAFSMSGGIFQLANMTTKEILALLTTWQGAKVFDTDTQTEVTYRCPTTTTCAWFPTQYGTALSQ